MTDDELLERLRQYSKPGRGDDHPQAVACREAKDRIESLIVENERLRDALSRIRDVEQGCGGSMSFKEMAESAMRQATAALGERHHD
jgi:hypothetical protein